MTATSPTILHLKCFLFASSDSVLNGWYVPKEIKRRNNVYACSLCFCSIVRILNSNVERGQIENGSNLNLGKVAKLGDIFLEETKGESWHYFCLSENNINSRICQ